MKKYISLLIIIQVLCFSISCSYSSIDDTYISTEDDYFQYNIDTPIFAYDISEDNNLFYLSLVSTSFKKGIDSQGEEITYPISESLLNVLNSEGDLINTYNMPHYIIDFCVVDNNILYTSNTEDYIQLYKYNLENQVIEKICNFIDYTDISKIEVFDDRLYFIGNNKNYFDKKYTLASVEDRFSYSGERFGFIDLKTGILKELAVDFPISFSKAMDGNIVIYAYNESNGYYFTELNNSTGSLSDPIYHALGNLATFDIFNDDNDFMYLKQSSLLYSLTVASLAPDKVERELIPNFPFTAVDNIKCQSGYTYCTDLNNKNIIRIKNSAYIRANKKITMLTTESTKSVSPFGCGYNIQRDTVTNEEMALALLSQDNSFDICSMYSMQEISENIRNKGSFYPLNKIKGVKEYLDSCFPNIKNAATNSDGDIWMIPVRIDVKSFLFNEQLCKDNDIAFSNHMEINTLYDTLDRLIKDSSKSELYLYLNNIIMGDLLYQYTRCNNSFNTDTFRKFADISKNKFNYITDPNYGNPSLLTKLSIEKSSDFLFLNPLGHNYLLDVADNKEIRACRVPSLADDKTSIASCYFITVNPASKNLKEALKYVTSLCSYLTSTKDRIIFKDRAIYPDTKVMDDLYEIFSNADIEFTYPDELYKDDFEKYLEGKMDLESMIKESDRRLDIFVKE